LFMKKTRLLTEMSDLSRNIFADGRIIIQRVLGFYELIF